MPCWLLLIACLHPGTNKRTDFQKFSWDNLGQNTCIVGNLPGLPLIALRSLLRCLVWGDRAILVKIANPSALWHKAKASKGWQSSWTVTVALIHGKLPPNWRTLIWSWSVCLKKSALERWTWKWSKNCIRSLQRLKQFVPARKLSSHSSQHCGAQHMDCMLRFIADWWTVWCTRLDCDGVVPFSIT